MRIVAACGNGMGTSMIIKIKLEAIVKELKLDAKIEAMSAGQARGEINSADIIVCSKHLADMFAGGKAKVVSIVNLMSDAEIREGLKKVI